MNENSSKQVLLSVLGIAVLVVAVVGVSFAFFTYSRAGVQTNEITTGEIFFDFTESTVASIENAFPGTAKDTMTFKIIGRNTNKTQAIKYTVYGEVQNAGTGQTKFADGEVLMKITETDATTNNYEDYTAAPYEGDDNVLVEGTIAETTSNVVQEFTINLKVADTVKISDTDPQADYCSSGYGTGDAYDDTEMTEVECALGETGVRFSDLYYGIKIRVEAGLPQYQDFQ